MPASRHQRLLDGTFADPCERFFCHVFDAIAAVVASVVPEAIGAEALGAGLGGFSSLAGPEIAGLTAGEIGAGAGALGGFSSLAGPEIAGLTAGEIGGGGLAGALGGGSDLLAGMGAFEAGGDAALGGGSLVPGGALTTGTGVGSQTALPAVSAGTGVGGPAAAAPVLPASVGAAPATTTGAFPAASAPDLSTADFSAMDAPGATGPGSNGGFLDRTLSSLTGGAIDKSDLGTILAGGGLAMNLLKSGQSLPGEKQLSGAASGLEATARGQAALGTQLEGFLQSGKLPPGVESGLRSATSAATATIKAQHAAHGTSGSSAEAADIQAANDRALAAGQQVALQLLQQGSTMVGQAANTEGMAANLYQAILANSLERDRDLGNSIGSFASALARSGDSSSGNSTITLKAA